MSAAKAFPDWIEMELKIYGTRFAVQNLANMIFELMNK